MVAKQLRRNLMPVAWNIDAHELREVIENNIPV
jgi:hypothetical protein